MDYSSQYQFAGGQPYQNFMPVPPLTPSNSHSAISDEYGRTSPPEGLPNHDAFTTFEYSQTFHDPSQHPRSNVPGPPTPPNAVAFAQQQQQQQQQQQHYQHQQGPLPGPNAPNEGINTSQGDGGAEDGNTARGSDDDEHMTPAQSRRKAQNRAAQRAFRERREKHVRDLETKLAFLEAAQEKVSTENERLKKEMQKMSTENEILRATSSSNGHGSHSPEPTMTGPQKYKPTDFYSNVLQGHPNKFPSHRIATSETGERLLGAGAAWDYIINHDLYKRGLVDVEDVSERLKNCARCDGQGPVFSESVLTQAMEMSVASGSDDLI